MSNARAAARYRADSKAICRSISSSTCRRAEATATRSADAQPRRAEGRTIIRGAGYWVVLGLRSPSDRKSPARGDRTGLTSWWRKSARRIFGGRLAPPRR
jgi:hypothetical protein